jgi:hypothetical protein
MEELRLWLPSIVASLMFVLNIWLALRAARKSELDTLRAERGAIVKDMKDWVTALQEDLKSKAGRSWVENIAQLASSAESRLQRLEADIDHLPTKEQFHQLHIAVETLSGDVRVMGATLKTTAEVTRRVDDYLLHEKRQ